MNLGWSGDSGAKTGLFQVPELVTSVGFAQIKDACLHTSESLVAEACNPERKRNVAVIFDDLSDELCRVADLAEFIRIAHPDEDFSLAAQDACIEVSALVEQLNTHVGIYSALRRSVEGGDRFPETEVDRHVARLFLQDFQQCGIHLGEAEREQVVHLTDKILRTGQIFSANCQVLYNSTNEFDNFQRSFVRQVPGTPLQRRQTCVTVYTYMISVDRESDVVGSKKKVIFYNYIFGRYYVEKNLIRIRIKTKI